MTAPIDDRALDQLFREAHTTYAYLDRPVAETVLRALWALANLGPTSVNMQPARPVWCVSQTARDRLADCAPASNAARIRAAPVSVVLGMDLHFHDRLPELWPHMPGVRDWYAHDPVIAREAALRNSTLQGAWLVMAARALGLGMGPMSGFDAGKVDAAFFAGTDVTVNFIATLGYADTTADKPRLKRLAFEDAGRIL